MMGRGGLLNKREQTGPRPKYNQRGRGLRSGSHTKQQLGPTGNHQYHRRN